MFKRLRTYWERQKIFREIGSFNGPGLVYAAAEGNLACLDILLRGGVSADAVSEKGVPALCRAVDKDNLPVIRMLMEAGANVNLPDSKGVTALMRAIKSPNRHIFTFLMEQDPDLEIQDHLRETALFKAVREGNTTLTRKLVESGAEVDLINSDGATPLMYATEQERIGIVKTLLGAGADPNIRNRAGQTVLDFSVQSPRLQRMIRRAGIDRRQEERRANGQGTPLPTELIAPVTQTMLSQFPRLGELVFGAMDATLQVLNSPYTVEDAAEKGRTVMQSLLNLPANGNGNGNGHAHNGNGQAAVPPELLMHQLEALLTWAQQPHTPNGNGNGRHSKAPTLNQDRLNQALWEGCKSGTEQVVALLLELGASVKAADEQGNTALHHAVAHPKVVRLLMRKGAMPTLTNQHGHTLLDLAKAQGHEATHNLLLYGNESAKEHE